MQVTLDFLPPGPGLAGRVAGLSGRLDLSGIRQALVAARDGLAAEAARGGEASAAARDAASWRDEDLSGFAARVAAAANPPAGPAPLEDAPALFYDCALSAAAERRPDEASLGFAALLGTPDARAHALVGLAICALRRDLVDAALALAVESFRPGPGPARAYCIAGLCALKRNDRRSAQAYLSGASRIARRAPAQVEDLGMAQRLLLSMHLWDQPSTAGLVDIQSQ